MSACDTHTWVGIHAGDYGFIGRLTIEQDGVAQNISTYTTRQFILQAPSGAIKTVDAVFDIDGADGVLKYTFLAGDIDEAGPWGVQARIAKSGVELTSSTLNFQVARRIEE